MEKLIEGYENYKITKDGSIFNIKTNRQIKTWLSKSGYLNVELYNKDGGKKFLLHRLIAMSFTDNPDNKTNVNHKDHNRQNNDIDNLEWVTPNENSNHMFRKSGKGTILKEKITKIYESKKWRTVDEFYNEIINYYI